MGRPPIKKNVYFRALPKLALPPPPLLSGNLVLLFRTSKTTFYAYYGKRYQRWQWWLDDNSDCDKGDFDDNDHHHLYWFLSCAQYVVFDVRKKKTKLPEMRGGEGGGELIWAMPESFGTLFIKYKSLKWVSFQSKFIIFVCFLVMFFIIIIKITFITIRIII